MPDKKRLTLPDKGKLYKKTGLDLWPTLFVCLIPIAWLYFARNPTWSGGVAQAYPRGWVFAMALVFLLAHFGAMLLRRHRRRSFDFKQGFKANRKRNIWIAVGVLVFLYLAWPRLKNLFNLHLDVSLWAGVRVFLYFEILFLGWLFIRKAQLDARDGSRRRLLPLPKPLNDMPATEDPAAPVQYVAPSRLQYGSVRPVTPAPGAFDMWSDEPNQVTQVNGIPAVAPATPDPRDSRAYLDRFLGDEPNTTTPATPAPTTPAPPAYVSSAAQPAPSEPDDADDNTVPDLPGEPLQVHSGRPSRDSLLLPAGNATNGSASSGASSTPTRTSGSSSGGGRSTGSNRDNRRPRQS